MISPEYAAGFFDGEGCVNITRNGKSCGQFGLRVFLVNTKRNILEEFQQQFGGFLCKPTQKMLSWKHFNSWTVTGEKAVDFLGFIRPYLKIKAAQADLGFDFWVFRHSPGRLNKHSRSAETLAVEQDFKNKLHSLNQKGLQEA